MRIETASDPETGKAKKHLKFEQEVKSQRAHVKGSLPMRPVKAGANTAIGYAHKKIYQAEDENIGIKAAHRTEGIKVTAKVCEGKCGPVLPAGVI